ncbi:MAG: GNAT family protein [Hydrogenophaga sp.]|nr:GNAT family protein [Hydrogenophaga sp.]
MREHMKPPAPEVLIPYEARHDRKTVEWLNSADLQSTFGLRRTVSEATHRTWVDSNSDTLIWAIVDPVGQHVGNVLLKVTERHRSGYFQIYIGEQSARGKGLGEFALRATLTRAFTQRGLHRVWLHTFPDNVAAEALYLKHGFVLEGTERDALLSNGIYMSQRRWSLLEHEWRALVSDEVPS